MLTRRATLAGLAVLGLPPAALARKAFPNRTITIVVPYPPGGPIDIVARLMAQEAAAELSSRSWSRTAPARQGSSAPARWPVPSPTATR